MAGSQQMFPVETASGERTRYLPEQPKVGSSLCAGACGLKEMFGAGKEKYMYNTGPARLRRAGPVL